MNLELGPEEEQIIAEKMKTGGYKSRQAVVRDALGLLRITPRSFEELRAMVDEGIGEFERGETKDWDVERFLDDVHKRHPAT